MSTRREQPTAQLLQERFMCSSEFAELRGISGMAVAKRCALLVSPAKRQLLWFIQGLSVLQGGCNTLAREILKLFPDRVGTHTMHEIGVRKGQHYTGREAFVIRESIRNGYDCTEDLLERERDIGDPVEPTWDDCPVSAPRNYGPPVPRQDLYEECFEAAKRRLPDFFHHGSFKP